MRRPFHNIRAPIHLKKLVTFFVPFFNQINKTDCRFKIINFHFIMVGEEHDLINTIIQRIKRFYNNVYIEFMFLYLNVKLK